jgi:hypothetical protein
VNREGAWAISSSVENLDGDCPPGSHIGTVELHITESPSGEAQIWARFGFQYVTGIMRLFEAGDVPTKGETCAKAGAKRSHSEMVCKIGRGVLSDDGEDVGDGSESEFVITPNSQPPAKNPT